MKDPLRMRLVTLSAEETTDVGNRLGKELLPGDMVALTGELGAGKTCLTKGISRGLQVPEESYVRSPSFMILNIYPGRHTLHHMDLYRIHTASEVEDLGYREFFYGDGVTVVEWAEKIPDMLPPDHLRVRFSCLDENRREILLESKGTRFENRRAIWNDTLSRFVLSGVTEPSGHP